MFRLFSQLGKCLYIKRRGAKRTPIVNRPKRLTLLAFDILEDRIVPAISMTSIVVNGGAPAYLDCNGNSVSLVGQNSVVEQLLVTFNKSVTLDSGAFTITNI